MIYIGIDPGKDGGIAYISDKEKASAATIPKIGSDVDLNKYCGMLRKLKEADDVYAVVEDVHSIFGSSAKSNFEFGKNNGHIEGFLVALGIPYTKVAPKAWQKQMWEGVAVEKINTGKKTKAGNIKYKTDTKATSLKAVKRIFPNIDLRRSERAINPHDGKVDALLLAEYCRRNF